MSFSINFGGIEEEEEEEGDEAEIKPPVHINGAAQAKREVLLHLVQGLRERLGVPAEVDNPEKVFVWLDRRLAERQLELNSLQALERAVRTVFEFSPDASIDTIIGVIKKYKYPLSVAERT